MRFLVCVFVLMAHLSAADPYIVGAYYYPWYGGAENPHWPEGVSNKPWIGYYDSSNPAVVKKQIDLAYQYGVDVFSVSWTGIDSPSEKKFKAGFLKAPNLSLIRFCLIYESEIRLGERSQPVIMDFNNPGVRERFISDLVYIARTYFGHPSYFKIGGRPVVSFYLAHRFSGEFSAVLDEARRQIRALGWTPYFIGDSLSAIGRNDLYIASRFDAATSYNFFSFAGFAEGIDTTGKLTASLRPLFWHFQYLFRDLTGAHKNQIDFQPSVLPQFDNTRGGKRGSARLLAQSKEEVVQAFQLGREILDSKLSGPKIVWITSWNEWHEGTAIEPTVSGGPKYPGGNHVFDFLEAVAEVFGRAQK